MMAREYVSMDASFQGLIGVAQINITPPSGIYAKNWGVARHDRAIGVHRPLILTCATFQTGRESEPLVLITADLGWWKGIEEEWTLRNGILQAFSLDESRLMFCLSHTHAGPSLYLEDREKPGGEFIPAYLDELLQKAIDAVRRALSSAVDSTLSWRYGKCGLATNRDLRHGGGNRFLVGFNPSAAADDTLLVGRITAIEDGKVIGTLVNYACHPTTLGWENQMISPDYIGAMREVLEGKTGAPCLFLQGASGELAPAEQYSGDHLLADRYGRQLGYAVLSTLAAMHAPMSQLVFRRTVESGAPLAIWERQLRLVPETLQCTKIVVELPLKDLPSIDEIEEAWSACEDATLKERLWRKRSMRQAVGAGNTSAMPAWIWWLGEVCIIGQANEAYSCFQKQLRKDLSPHPVAVINIVNGYVGYLPPYEKYDSDMYSVWQTPFAAGSLEQLTARVGDTARNLMK